VFLAPVEVKVDVVGAIPSANKYEIYPIHVTGHSLGGLNLCGRAL
jgi:hypothetical protein